MNAIDWQDDCKLGIPSIDADHRHLHDLLNLFLRRASEEAEPRELAQILNTLIERTREHFAREEAMMDRTDYPELAAHKAEHDRLLAQLGHIHERYLEGEAPHQLTRDTAEFLTRWLVDHIRHEDKAYRPFVMRLT